MSLPADLTPMLSDSQKINLNIISMNTAINDLQHIVERHEKLLVTGNGEIPLVEKIRNMESFVGGMKYWIKFLIGTILVQTISFGVAAIVYFIRLYPLLEKISNQP